ncbi:hypothetical protein OF83DRAFT_611825 [Amylostereum chailletii]|nr:hypothetical protein OF83DRAFT_611825 [Amylostereum chailletii]
MHRKNGPNVPIVSKAAAAHNAPPALRPSSAVPKSVANKTKFSSLGRRTVAQEHPQPGPRVTVEDVPEVEVPQPGPPDDIAPPPEVPAPSRQTPEVQVPQPAPPPPHLPRLSRKTPVEDVPDVPLPAPPAYVPPDGDSMEDLYAPLKFRGAPQAQWGGAAAARLSTNLARHAGERTTDELLREIFDAATVPKELANEFTQRKLFSSLNDWGAHLFQFGVLEKDAWTVQTVRKYGASYLRTRVIATPGRYGPHVKASTLQEWLITFVSCIVMYCHDGTTNELVGLRLLIQANFYKTLEDEMESLIQEYKLDRKREPVHRFGRHEVRQLLIEALANSTNVGRLVKLQTCCAILIGFILGARPGSLAASSSGYRELGKYLKLKNITIERVGVLEFNVTLNIDNWKGFQQGAYQKEQDYILEPVKLVHNLPLEPSTWIVAYLLERGAFGPNVTADTLITDHTAMLEIVPEMLEEAFFLTPAAGGPTLTTTPATSGTLYSTISNLARNAHLPSTGLYALRRETGNYYITVLNKEHAAGILGHSSRDFRTLSRHYSRGPANLSLTRIRLGDFDEEASEMTRSSLGLHERGCAAVMALIGRIDPEKKAEGQAQPANDVDFTGRGTTTLAKVVFTDEQTAELDNDLVVRRLARRIIVVWDHWISFLVSDGASHKPFAGYVDEDRRKVKQNMAVIMKRADVHFVDPEQAAAIPDLEDDPDVDNVETEAKEAALKSPLSHSLRTGVALNNLSNAEKLVLERAGKARIKLNVLYAVLVSRRATIAKRIRSDVNAQRALDASIVRRAATVGDRAAALDHLKTTVPLLAEAMATTSAPEPSTKDVLRSAIPWPVSNVLAAPVALEVPVQPKDENDLASWQTYHEQLEIYLAARNTETPQEQETLASTLLEREVVVKFNGDLRAMVHATKQRLADTSQSENQGDNTEGGFVQERDIAGGHFQLDSPSESNFLPVDMSIVRPAFFKYLCLPLATERQRKAQYQNADGRWCCDEPGCEITLESWRHLLRHQIVHTLWRRLLDSADLGSSLQRKHRWVCPVDKMCVCSHFTCPYLTSRCRAFATQGDLVEHLLLSCSKCDEHKTMHAQWSRTYNKYHYVPSNEKSKGVGGVAPSVAPVAGPSTTTPAGPSKTPPATRPKTKYAKKKVPTLINLAGLVSLFSGMQVSDIAERAREVGVDLSEGVLDSILRFQGHLHAFDATDLPLDLTVVTDEEWDALQDNTLDGSDSDEDDMDTNEDACI